MLPMLKKERRKIKGRHGNMLESPAMCLAQMDSSDGKMYFMDFLRVARGDSWRLPQLHARGILCLLAFASL